MSSSQIDTPNVTTELTRDLDALLSQAVEQNIVHSVTFALTGPNDLIYEGGFGPNGSLDAVAAIASMTKPLTCLAALQLVAQGKLSLDQPVSEIVPEFSTIQLFDGVDEAGGVVMRPPATPVTLRHLLTHTSGLGYDTWSDKVIAYRHAMGLAEILPHEARIPATPLIFEPGTAWHYSTAIDWIGRMIEEVSGKRLGAAMRAQIFEPLGMNSTGFEITADMRARLMPLTNRVGRKAVIDATYDPPSVPVSHGGGGGLYSSTGDYLRFLQAMLRGGSGLLPEHWFDEFARDQIAALSVQPLHSTHPARSNHVHILPGIDKGWSFGFMVNRRAIPGRRAAQSLA